MSTAASGSKTSASESTSTSAGTSTSASTSTSTAQSATRHPGRRPRSVRLVTVLSWIEGFIDIAGGLLLLGIAGASVLDPVQGGILVAGAAGIALGLVLVFVTGGLLRGNRASRIAVTILTVFSMAPAVVTLSLTLWLNGGITIALGLAIIVLLWFGPARRHFIRTSKRAHITQSVQAN